MSTLASLTALTGTTALLGYAATRAFTHRVLA